MWPIGGCCLVSCWKKQWVTPRRPQERLPKNTPKTCPLEKLVFAFGRMSIIGLCFENNATFDSNTSWSDIKPHWIQTFRVRNSTTFDSNISCSKANHIWFTHFVFEKHTTFDSNISWSNIKPHWIQTFRVRNSTIFDSHISCSKANHIWFTHVVFEKHTTFDSNS